MKLFLLRAFCLLNLVLFTSCSTIASPTDTNPPPRLTVELRDGSRVIGTSVEKISSFIPRCWGI